ncbi:hypothetical protein ZIOFF_051066 [Zingiber officinale]|uniref:Leucine-rich repeat-containing N-terminal plant-type domain-containing protein n=1 Tax=Zingiber officinale TaxID=94328 RepID=A0A8J5FJX2_ZINOF|nr:hypothetical protein ZIOFF_051066 [Zingiber officinale]
MAAAALNLLLYLFWISLSFFSRSLQLCVEKERRALPSVRSGFPTECEKWFPVVDRPLSPWKGDECCSGEGVGCNNITGRVIELDLSAPDDMTPTNKSEHLDLSFCGFSGEIPNQLGNLSDLLHTKEQAFQVVEVPNTSWYLSRDIIVGIADLRNG